MIFIFSLNMAQAEETRCLTKEQIETTMKNYITVNNLEDVKVIDSGKPIFSKETEAKFNIPHITMFADNYTVYQTKATDPRSGKKYNLYIIILEATKFNKLFVSATIYFYKKHIEGNINPNGFNGRPQVILAPAFRVTEQMTSHIPINVLPCLYRFVSIVEFYPMIGSRNGIYGLSRDYEVIPYEPLYNGREYPIIFDSDPMAKLLNTIPNDIIKCKICRAEGFSVYDEYYFRRVESTNSDVGVIAPSGICEGNNQTAADRINLEESNANDNQTQQPSQQQAQTSTDTAQQQQTQAEQPAAKPTAKPNSGRRSRAKK